MFAGALGLGQREIHVFERAAALEIKSRLKGDKAQVSVEAVPDGLGILWGAFDRATISASHFEVDGLPLFVEPERSKAGRCGNLEIKLRDFKLKGLRVESLSAQIPACRYDRGLALHDKKFRLSRSGTGTGSVRVLEDDLADFIKLKFHEIKSVSVKVHDGIVWVEGFGEFLLIKSNFEVVASLATVGGTQLYLTDAKVWFDWVPAAQVATESLLKLLNPVVDFNKDLGLLDTMKVESIILEDGVLEARGKTKIPSRPPVTVLPKSPESFGRVGPSDFLSSFL